MIDDSGTPSAPATETPSVPVLVEHLFRRQAGQLTAALTRSFGAAHLQLVEEVVQDALIQALKRWPFSGVPESPVAWLHRVARNLALDRLRRHGRFQARADVIREQLESRLNTDGEQRAGLGNEITDDQLRLIFLCCHPELAHDARVALTLKLVAGFGIDEIARAFLAQPSTIAQRLVRAKARIRQHHLSLELPSPEESTQRLNSVLETLYLMFNEGYAAHDGDRLVRDDLCVEAVRLVELVASIPRLATPTVHALAALLYLQASRLDARLDSDGEIVKLADQDRSRWSAGAIRCGYEHLRLAGRGEQLSSYHLQAAIAAEHAIACPQANTTDWHTITSLYNQLMTVAPSPVVLLNRAVAVCHSASPAIALDSIAHLESDPQLVDYYLLHAVRADLLTLAGRVDDAVEALERALVCRCSGPERRLLERRLAALTA